VKDEVVTDTEVVAEGKGPPVPREDGISAHSKDDINRPEELWPALLHQHDLSRGSVRGVDYPLDYIGQPEGDEALGINGDEDL
jgi:hypothetical protein